MRRRALWLVLLWLALALRLFRLDAQNVWWDEARNIDVAGRPLAAIAGAVELDIHPPLYFYLLHGWRALAGAGEFAVRFLSVLPGVLLVPLLYALGRKLAGEWAGLAAAALAAIVPFLVSEAQEARMYTWAYLWLALAGWAAWRMTADKSRARPAVALGVVAALALLTHYSVVFVLGPLYALLGLWAITGPSAERWARLRAGVFSGLLAALLFLPQLPRALSQINPYRNPTLTVPRLSDYLAACWQAFNLGTNYAADMARPWLWAVGLVLAAGVALWLARGGAWRAVAALAWLVLAPLALYYAVLSDRAAFAPRYISFVMPAYLLLFGLAVAGWRRLHRLAVWPVGLVLLAAIVPAQRSDYFDPAYFTDDTHGLAAWLADAAGPDDLILFDVPYPWRYYYHGAAAAHYLFVDINTVAARLNDLAPGHERVFWVRWYKSDTDPRGAVPWLLAQYGTPEGEQAFRGYQVAWYRLPPDVSFHLADALQPAQADFGGAARLVGYQAAARGGAVWAALRWQVTQADADYKVSLRLRDAAGQTVAQDDRYLINDRHLRARHWDAGEAATNVYTLSPSGGLPPGTYTLHALAYHPDTLAALGITGQDGGESAVATLEVTVR